LFVIAVEGAKTEPAYFGIFAYQESIIRVKCLEGQHDSSPPQILKRMEANVKKEGLRPSDEAWLVVDRDHWTEGQLDQLDAWAQKRANRGFAVSNPNFEYWLLLHFEEGKGVAAPQRCSERLKRHLPDYDKNFDPRRISRQQIDHAIRRAKHRDTPPCVDWPRNPGRTTVYRLVENILNSATANENSVKR